MASKQAVDGATLLRELIAECMSFGASDLHINAEYPPFVRVGGALQPLPGRMALSRQQIIQAAESLYAGYDLTPLKREGSLDGALTANGDVRFRFNIFQRQGELAIALRKLEEAFLSLPELGLPESLSQFCGLRDGLVVLAGPTGAGKSTTLATLIDMINRNRACHIITIEDPIEYVHIKSKSLVNQRQIGLDASRFSDALVAALRQDPDVILVGEMRDIDTIRAAITASETGHLVFSTVHAGDCVSGVERMVAAFPADEQDSIRRQLSLVLRAVVCQHLLPRARDARCYETRDDSGAYGRVAVSEVMLCNRAIANLIAVGKSAQIYSAMETGVSQGMQTLEQDLARLLVRGDISEDVAMTVASNPVVLRERLRRMESKS